MTMRKTLLILIATFLCIFNFSYATEMDMSKEIEMIDAIENDAVYVSNEKGKLIINPIIAEGTTPFIDGFYIDIYNIETGEMSHLLLNRDNGYKNEIELNKGDYSLSLDTESLNDDISLEHDRILIGAEQIIVNINIEGLTEDEQSAIGTGLEGESEALKDDGITEEKPNEDDSFDISKILSDMLFNNMFIFAIIIVLLGAYYWFYIYKK